MRSGWTPTCAAGCAPNSATPGGGKSRAIALEDSIPVHGDDVAHVLRWRDRDTDGFRHDPVRLRFEYADADVYGVAT